MNTPLKYPQLLGYVDKLSVRPGQTLEFKVSSKSSEPFSARLTRSISADPNPDGPGIVEEDASAFFEPQQFPSNDQPFFPGSCAIARSQISLDADAAVVFSAAVYSTLRTDRPQSVLSVGFHDLCLDASGAASLRVGDVSVSTERPLSLGRWYRIEGRSASGKISISQQPLGRDVTTAADAELAIDGETSVVGTPIVAACMGARSERAAPDQCFNGKIEAPTITADGETICAWDFSRDMSSTVVPATAGPDLELANFPARAMTGTQWDGSEMNWTHRPDHYTAIHFHEDDIYDFHSMRFPFLWHHPTGSDARACAYWCRRSPTRSTATTRAPTISRLGRSESRRGARTRTIRPSIRNTGCLPTTFTTMAQASVMHLIVARCLICDPGI